MKSNYVLTIAFKYSEDDEIIECLKSKRNKSMFIREVLYDYLEGGFKRNPTIVGNDDIMQVLLQVDSMVRDIKGGSVLQCTRETPPSSVMNSDYTNTETYLENSSYDEDIKSDVCSNAKDYDKYAIPPECDNILNNLMSAF